MVNIRVIFISQQHIIQSKKLLLRAINHLNMKSSRYQWALFASVVGGQTAGRVMPAR